MLFYTFLKQMSYNGLSYLLFSYIFSEIDDDGNVLSVMLSDDLANTFLMFGKEEYGTTEPIILQENRLVPLTSKKKPFLRDTPRVWVNYFSNSI